MYETADSVNFYFNKKLQRSSTNLVKKKEYSVT